MKKQLEELQDFSKNLLRIKMTKKQRLFLYWDMYFVAVGISTLMTVEEVNSDTGDIPLGFCKLMEEFGLASGHFELLPELEKQEPYGSIGYSHWHPSGDWKPRAKDLLEAIKLCN